MARLTDGKSGTQFRVPVPGELVDICTLEVTASEQTKKLLPPILMRYWNLLHL